LLSDLTTDGGGCGGVFGDYGTLRVDPSEQRAFVATSRCIAEIPLPPLPE
jgi:hypothetical protein